MILDTSISIYGNVTDRSGHVGTLGDFLRLCIANKEIVDRLRRSTSDDEKKQIKTQLPAATISGVFAPTRATKNLTRHSGLICVDIDHCEDCAAIMAQLADMENVAFVSRSVSGHGVFAIIPLAYPDKHKQQFEALRRYFRNIGIELDRQCSDITRLRVISYDPDAVIRLDAVPYRGIYEEPRHRDTYTHSRYKGEDWTLKNVAKCVDKILSARVDITDGYNNWRDVGFSLASLGESGRDFFHAVSSIYPGYNREQCDRKFTELCKSVNRIHINTFFEICRNYGITYKD